MCSTKCLIIACNNCVFNNCFNNVVVEYVFFGFNNYQTTTFKQPIATTKYFFKTDWQNTVSTC